MATIDLISPVYDMRINDVWFEIRELLQCEYSELYDKMFLDNIARCKMRTANLLHLSSKWNIKEIQRFDPELYNKFIEKFGNIEFESQYQKILYKPEELTWKEYLSVQIDIMKDEEIKEVLKQKIISFLLAWKYSGYTITTHELNDILLMQKMGIEFWINNVKEITKKSEVKNVILLADIPEVSLKEELASLRDNENYSEYREEIIKHLEIPYIDAIDTWKKFVQCVYNRDIDFTTMHGTNTYHTKLLMNDKIKGE